MNKYKIGDDVELDDGSVWAIIGLPGCSATFPNDYQGVNENNSEGLFPESQIKGYAQWTPAVGDTITVTMDGKWSGVIIAIDGEFYVCRMEYEYPHDHYQGFSIYNITKGKSERDEWIDRAIEVIGGRSDNVSTEYVLGKTYDAGLVKDTQE